MEEKERGRGRRKIMREGRRWERTRMEIEERTEIKSGEEDKEKNRENPATLAPLLCRPLFNIKDQSDISEPRAGQLVSGNM